MALPIRPVGGGPAMPPKPVIPEPPLASSQEDLALPELDFSLPELEDTPATVEAPSMPYASPNDLDPPDQDFGLPQEELKLNSEALPELDQLPALDDFYRPEPQSENASESQGDDLTFDSDYDFDALFASLASEDEASATQDNREFPEALEDQAITEEAIDEFESFIDQAFDDVREDSQFPDSEPEGAEESEFDRLLAESDDEEAPEGDEVEGDFDQEDSFSPLKKNDSNKDHRGEKKPKKKSLHARLSEGFFRGLTLIPFIGRIFKPLQRFASFLTPLLILVLILAIPFGVYTFAGSQVASSSAITFPDGGSATMSDFSFDASTMEASGVITNTGDVIGDLQPVFEVWVYQLSLEPSEWFSYQLVGECVGDIVTVAIDSSSEASASCDFENVDGLTPKVTGSLVY